MHVSVSVLDKCQDAKIVNGTIGEDEILATLADLDVICGRSCAKYLDMAKWAICGLNDGQIFGLGHFGHDGVYKSTSVDVVFGCWVVCKEGTR